ncbi:MAG: glycosyltransferase [Hyphomicrobium sp.]|jgi:UDP:flavonoid glycosyltransferase YjiC (YdhE family)
MRIAIQTLGTRGDVQPYIALALGLMARGHVVQLAAPEQYVGLVGEYGVQAAPLPGEFLALLDMPEGKAAIAGSEGFAAGFKLLKHVRPMMRRLFDAEWSAVEAFRPDLIVYHPKSLAAPHIAEKLLRPAVLASPLPGFTPTAAFPSPLLPLKSLGPLNRPSHLLATKAPAILFGRLIREWRSASLGLSGARADAPAGTLYAYSPHVIPKPADWGQDVLVSGYWFLDNPDWHMPPDLEGFLAAGEPPIYVGFGSMPGLDPYHLSAIVIEALARTGNRGILVIGGGALSAQQQAPHVLCISSAPHDRLLPHVKATIHHGGAGTTAAALRAGKPTTICPFFGDQPFWAKRVVALGAGPAPLVRKSLSVESMAAAIDAMADPKMQSTAARLGEAINAEHGIDQAVGFLEQQVAPPASHSV